MKQLKFFLITTCVLVGIFFHCGCVEHKQDDPIVMTFGELIDDYRSSYNWEAAYRIENFTSLKDGDNLIIRDQIHVISYMVDTDTTHIEFNSSIGLDNLFPIQGNITDVFGVGDIVEIHLHIIKVTFNTVDNERMVIIERETFKEGYDTITNTYIPVPAEFISPAKKIN